MDYSEDLLKKIVSLGTLAYPLEKIINVLDISDADIHQFTKDFDTPTHSVYKAYKRGLDKGDFAIDSKLYDLARSGDIDAIREFKHRKDINQDKETNDHELRRIKRSK